MARNLVHRLLHSICTLVALFQLTECLKVPNLVPHYCGQIAENNRIREHQLSETGNSSFLVVGANILQGLDIPTNYRCSINILSPKGSGLILTVRHSALNKNDTITFKSGTSPETSWRKHFKSHDSDENDGSHDHEEIVTSISATSQRSIVIRYDPTPGNYDFNAGFELAVTTYRDKRQDSDCGTDFDCGNDRCISPDLECDGYNNCGNNHDEARCTGVSWLIVALLVLVALIVVVLACLVWVRMSR